MWRRVLIVLTGAMLGFLLMATAFGLIIDAPHLLLLLRRHSETSGQVLRLYPNSHGLMEIGYSVGGTKYKREVPGFGFYGPRVEGRPIRVYYDPSNPSVAFTAPPGEILAGQLPAWIGASLLGSVFGVSAILNFIRFRHWLNPGRR